MLRLIRLCPGADAASQTALPDALAALRLTPMSESCPATSELWTAAQQGAGGGCPVRQGQSLIPNLGWNCGRDQMDLKDCH